MTQSVLVVDSQPVQLGINARTLTDLGYDVTVVTTFEEGKRRLSAQPPLALLIADIRLGPYNGLHLALRARSLHPNICIIITDQTFDPALEREARGMGATYVVKPISPAKLTTLVTQMFSGHSDMPSTSRRWQRIPVSEPLPAAVGRVPGRVVDMSYGGVRLKFAAGEATTLPQRMDLVLPDRGLTFTIHPVWVRSAADSDGWLCGGELVDDSAGSVQEWRRFVDSYSASA
jgi:DNA-binding response OmpR family regulator